MQSWGAGAAAYGASKTAFWSLTNSLRLELAAQHTHVVGVHLGFADTDMVRQLTTDKIAPDQEARAVFDGLERGEQEILVDDVTRRMKAALSGPVETSPFPSSADTVPPSFTRTHRRTGHAPMADTDKQRFAADITEFYTGLGLPEFYVVVLFTGVEESSFYIGRRPVTDAVRIVVDHLARHLDALRGADARPNDSTRSSPPTLAKNANPVSQQIRGPPCLLEPCSAHEIPLRSRSGADSRTS